MRRIMVIGAVAATVVVAAGLVAAATRDERIREPMRIHVVERATTDTVVDTDGDGADSTGDLLTFHNRVFDASNTERVGRSPGDGVRIDPDNGTWECRYITILSGGGITVEGPFFERRDESVLAVTGGTGRFHNARGELVLRPRGATAFDFIFRLIP